MPEMDLSNLTGPELKRLLKAARARNDGPLADRVDWEIAKRGAGGARPVPIAVQVAAQGEAELDAPAFSILYEREDEAPTFHAFLPGPGPEPDPLTAEGFTLEHRKERAQRLAGRLRPPRTSAGGGGPRGAALVAAGLLAGSLITAGAFWGLRDAPQQPAPRVMTARSAPPAPAPPPVAPAAEPDTPIDPALEQIAAEAAAEAEVEPEAEPEAPAEVTPQLAETEPERPARVDPCARAPTPADRLVCSDLEFERLDLELRDAYARARAASVDPVVLGPAHSAWRLARDETSDPVRLARLYDTRIRELNEATAEARRPPQ